MTKVEMTEGEEEEEECAPEELPNSNKVLDPRAGKVDVVLPQLPFDAAQIAQVLLKNRFAEGSNKKARKTISKVAHEYVLIFCFFLTSL